jgi:UDP-N-acetylmuramoyl-L-alanyl-D-glutamate--2,6-diaminopimelate ligase
VVKGNGISLLDSANGGLLEVLGSPLIQGTCPTQLRQLIWDDRQDAADLFVAIRGTVHDGADSIPVMIERGIRGIVSETAPPSNPPEDLTWWQVKNSREAFARLVHRACGNPGEQIQVFGITGTNGKSSTVHLLASILRVAGRNPGWVTTVDQSVAGTAQMSDCTTPSADLLARHLRDHHEAGGQSMVLEISSHAIDQHRTTGIPLVAAAVTQFGRDHLDYHGTVEEYHAVKRRLRKQVAAGGVFLLPLETQGSEVGFEDVNSGRRWTGSIQEQTSSGMKARLEGDRWRMDLQWNRPALHDLSNALCAAVLADSAGISISEIQQGLEQAHPVPGRMEQVAEGVFVDYAHTPDALDSVLKACRMICRGELRVLFGCGGDRDQGKRSEMGQVAACHADEIFLTDDNPRSEPSDQILEQIRKGVGTHPQVIECADRRQAIRSALQRHQPQDLLLIAGKGHETTQEIRGESFPFDDREVVREELGGVT